MRLGLGNTTVLNYDQPSFPASPADRQNKSTVARTFHNAHAIELEEKNHSSNNHFMGNQTHNEEVRERLATGHNDDHLVNDDDSLGGDHRQFDTPCLSVMWKRVGLHFALLLGVVLYICLGALMFQMIELRNIQDSDADDMKVNGELLHQIRAHIHSNVSVDIKQRLQSILNDLQPIKELQVNDLTNQTLDHSTYKRMHSWQSFPAAILFTFTTISTVGYGHVAPSTELGVFVCILYSLIGIPLFMIAVADLGKFMWESIKWLLQGRIKHNHLGELPLRVAVLFVLSLFFTYLLLGAMLLPLWESEMSFAHAFYLSFITVTTVGFGDIIPEDAHFLVITLVYMFFGLAITTLAIEVLAAAIRQFHYWGYPIRGARLATVWVGGKMLTIDHLLRSMAREMGVGELEMQQFQQNFDEVLEKTVTDLTRNGTISLDDYSAITQDLAEYRSKRAHLLNMVDQRRFSGVYDNIPESWTTAMKYMIFMEEDPRVWLNLDLLQLDNVPLKQEVF